MGLIKAAKDSISTLLADQWREYFYCDSLSSDTLMVKGQKRITEGRNSNTKGIDNIISNGSIIAVNEGQCMIIVDQGGVVDLCAEAGQFIYESSSEPSVFYGKLGENVKNTFSTMWSRFTFGGNAAKDQRVYFFNMKEIVGNLYGTATPIDFHLVSPKTGFEFETVVFSPVMNIAPASVSLSLPLLCNTVPNVNFDSVIVTLSPVRQIIPPFEVDAPVTGSAYALPLQL